MIALCCRRYCVRTISKLGAEKIEPPGVVVAFPEAVIGPDSVMPSALLTSTGNAVRSGCKLDLVGISVVLKVTAKVMRPGFVDVLLQQEAGMEQVCVAHLLSGLKARRNERRRRSKDRYVRIAKKVLAGADFQTLESSGIGSKRYVDDANRDSLA